MVLNIRQKQIGAAPPPQRECGHIVPIELVVWLSVVCFDFAHSCETRVLSLVYYFSFKVICNMQDCRFFRLVPPS